MLTIYGISNCDSCRKARKWLDTEGVAYHYHDIRVDGVDREMLDRWLAVADWKILLNTRIMWSTRLGALIILKA